MRPYILAESNWKFIKGQAFDLAILPWGATEAHNYHLPYGTDIIEADKIAAEGARIAWESGSKVTVLPTIPFGVNTGQRDILLDINIYPSTQQAILNDVIETLNRQGIKKLLIVNSHGGNEFKPLLRELGANYPEMFLASCNWFQAVDKSKFFDEEGDHADEMETSLLLHFCPELVLPLDQAGLGKAKHHKVAALNEGWASAERRWSEITTDTGVGDPSKATPEKGARFFEAVSDKLASLIQGVAEMDISDIYE